LNAYVDHKDCKYETTIESLRHTWLYIG